MAIETDLAGDNARSKPLDVDARGALQHIHRRVGTAMLFESSGGQLDRVAHLPSCASPWASRRWRPPPSTTLPQHWSRRGSSCVKWEPTATGIHHQATLRKAVADLGASLDEENEVKPAIRALVQREFAKGNDIPKVYFPQDSNAVPDDPA